MVVNEVVVTGSGIRHGVDDPPKSWTQNTHNPAPNQNFELSAQFTVLKLSSFPFFSKTTNLLFVNFCVTPGGELVSLSSNPTTMVTTRESALPGRVQGHVSTKKSNAGGKPDTSLTVSYTHLTLPTICSV